MLREIIKDALVLIGCAAILYGALYLPLILK